MVLSTALFGRPAFKHVIVNGLVQAEDGQKMSKRLRNYPELDHVLGKYGADALRLYLMGSPVVRAEDLNFSERGVDEVLKKTVQRLENSLALYDLGKGSDVVAPSAASDAVLDRWIISRLYQLIREMEESLEKYEVDRATRPIADFVDDFSAWYLRRSRDRFKGEDAVDRLNALATTRYVIEEFSKALAPIAPFLAEHLYQHMLVGEGAWQGSVHLASWPSYGFVDEKLLEEMKTARRIVEAALAARQKAGIKVRQPLARLTTSLLVPQEFHGLILDEVNVKQLVHAAGFPDEVALDTTITEDLKREGEFRELLRSIQDARKDALFTPGQSIVLTLPKQHKDLAAHFDAELRRAVNATEVVFSSDEEIHVASNS